ncbi:DNA-3-methyladenine glycosylase [Bosea vaviloviae]|uniref:Putative 3-methyladenine DNA glycosylase n=1 Tax=Bosea vaviloviae TaxID=1526658 RepID=A0A1D7U1V4_9HYPH|nr:DNA-3-methyladenine glycosylase [Bosea vaviloviae]AOO81342.1 3-methyladenine DNA glycosylase [Bosea vaviloviae]
MTSGYLDDHDLTPLPAAFFDRAAPELAMRLIGVSIFVDGVGGVIVETEAYTRDDPASHSFRGPTLRNAAMFGPAGTAYIYRSYGLHWCFNIVASGGGAVLLRALEPTAGFDIMLQRRGGASALCSGPGRLAQALAIDASHDALPVDQKPFSFSDRSCEPNLTVGPRIGISQAREKPWRFGLQGSPHLSRRFPVSRRLPVP